MASSTRARWLALLSALWMCAPAYAAGPRHHYVMQGDSVWSATHLIEAEQGSLLSARMAGLVGGGFETSGGTWVGFNQWYSSKWQDARLSWMTQLSPNLGLIWGMSTGERGGKYAIDPSVKLGFVVQTQMTRQTSLSLRATSIVGGRLRERACVANYGDIGGVQSVNCRMAASMLPPSQTLGYLFNEKPYNKETFFVQFTWNF